MFRPETCSSLAAKASMPYPLSTAPIKRELEGDRQLPFVPIVAYRSRSFQGVGPKRQAPPEGGVPGDDGVVRKNVAVTVDSDRS